MTLPIISLILPHLFDIARTVVRDEIADPSAPIRSDAPAAAAERVGGRSCRKCSASRRCST